MSKIEISGTFASFWNEAMTIWAFHGLHWYADYLIKENKRLGKVLKMKEVSIRVFSSFVGNGYVQLDGAVWKGEQEMHF